MKTFKQYLTEEQFDLEKALIKDFGITNNFNVAGYITPNGKLLNFEDDSDTSRFDHREVNRILDRMNIPEYEKKKIEVQNKDSAGLVYLVSIGYVRVNGYGGIDIIVQPTDKQFTMITKQIIKLNKAAEYNDDIEEYYVDINNDKGQVVKHLSYYFPNIKPYQIISDIKQYTKKLEIQHENI